MNAVLGLKEIISASAVSHSEAVLVAFWFKPTTGIAEPGYIHYGLNLEPLGKSVWIYDTKVCGCVTSQWC